MIQIFPNPSNDFVNVSLGFLAEEVPLNVLDFSGRILIRKKYFNDNQIIVENRKSKRLKYIKN